MLLGPVTANKWQFSLGKCIFCSSFRYFFRFFLDGWSLTIWFSKQDGWSYLLVCWVWSQFVPTVSTWLLKSASVSVLLLLINYMLVPPQLVLHPLPSLSWVSPTLLGGECSAQCKYLNLMEAMTWALWFFFSHCNQLPDKDYMEENSKLKWFRRQHLELVSTNRSQVQFPCISLGYMVTLSVRLNDDNQAFSLRERLVFTKGVLHIKHELPLHFILLTTG